MAACALSCEPPVSTARATSATMPSTNAATAPSPTPTPVPTPALVPSSAPQPSASAVGETDGSRTKCNTTADCQAGFHCALGLPLRGACWKDGTPEPRCLSEDTLIDTPAGPTTVRDLAVGALVFTVDAAGRRVVAPLLAASHFDVPRSHEMSRVVFDDGRELLVSPGHPTCGSARSSSSMATLADLAKGERYDGGNVTRAERVPYGHDATFDILPGGESGCYWANGVLLGSTLR